MHAYKKKTINQRLRCGGLCAVTVVSSANRMSLLIVTFTFVLGFKQDGLKSLPYVRVSMYMPSSAVPKTCLRSSEKEMPKSVGASTQLC